MMKFLFLALFFPIIFLFSSCSDSTPTIKSVGNISLPSNPAPGTAPIYGEEALPDEPINPTPSTPEDEEPEGEDVSDPEDTPPVVTEPEDVEPEAPSCDLDSAAINEYFNKFQGTNNSSLNLYNLKVQGDAGAYPYNGLGIYMLNISGNKLFIWTKIITLSDPSNTSSDITNYEYVKYGQIDIESIDESNIDAASCSIKISNSSMARTYWTKDDMDEGTGEVLPDNAGHGDSNNVVILIDPKADTIKLTIDSKTLEATAKGSSGPLANIMKIQ